MNITAFFSVKAIVPTGVIPASGLHPMLANIKFGNWTNNVFTAAPLVVTFNTEKSSSGDLVFQRGTDGELKVVSTSTGEEVTL
jgi:hypothetical protein